MNSPLKVPITIAFAAILIVVLPQIARAQRCPPSNLSYLVRDAKGVPIDVTRTDFQYEKDSGSRYREWGVRKPGFDKDQGSQVPADIVNLMKKTSTLETFEGCVFKTPVTLRLTIKGKTMNLTFVMPKVDDDYGGHATYLVDSIPFHAGKFEIGLVPKGGYYAGRNWKRVRE